MTSLFLQVWHKFSTERIFGMEGVGNNTSQMIDSAKSKYGKEPDSISFLELSIPGKMTLELMNRHNEEGCLWRVKFSQLSSLEKKTPLRCWFFEEIIQGCIGLRRREEEASRQLAMVTVQLEQSKTSQQQAMNHHIMMQQHQILMLLIPQMQRPPLSPQGSQHSAPSQHVPSYPMGQMPFQSQFPMPIYRPQMASPGDSHISAGVFNGKLSWGLFSRLLLGSFDGDVMRYLGAHGSGSIE